MTDQAIAIDLGGTKTSWALVNPSYEITNSQEIPTPKSAEGIVAAIKNIISETLVDAEIVRGIGIGVAGLVDHTSGTIVAAPNLPLDGISLTDALKPEITLECKIDNDANLAALGELYSGEGRKKQLFIGLTVGTGVGGGIVSNGNLWRGAYGTAAEFGHMVVSADGIPCTCGGRGCLEQMASGTALERRGREVVDADSDSELGRLFDGDSSQVTGRAISQAAQDGNPAALDLLHDLSRWLGIGIGNLINILNPEIVIIGGGVAPSLKGTLDTVRDEVRKVVVDPRAKETPLVLSKLQNTAGLIGAAGVILG